MVARAGFIIAIALSLAGCGDGLPPVGKYATISGRLTDAGNGAPISFATVTVNGVLFARTDADGNYKITTVPSGPWSWAARATGYGDGGSDSPAPLAPGEQRTFAITLKHR